MLNVMGSASYIVRRTLHPNILAPLSVVESAVVYLKLVRIGIMQTTISRSGGRDEGKELQALTSER